MQVRYGLVPAIDPTADVVVLAHSLLGRLPERPFRGVRIVRDPRDIWVSGYLYHRHCAEPWCVAISPDVAPPIGFPAVPMAFVHRRERWKRGWVERLEGRSYQANLLGREREAGLDFELAGYAGATFEDMAAWPHAGIPDVKLEQIVADFDGVMEAVLRQLGFAEERLPELMELAREEDLARMDEARLAASAHIHGRRISKWREVLTTEQAGTFGRRYGALLAGLGYPAD
jgi:hypothetical protein